LHGKDQPPGPPGPGSFTSVSALDEPRTAHSSRVRLDLLLDHVPVHEPNPPDLASIDLALRDVARVIGAAYTVANPKQAASSSRGFVATGQHQVLISHIHLGSPLEVVGDLSTTIGFVVPALAAIFYATKRLWGIDLEWRAYREDHRARYFEAKRAALEAEAALEPLLNTRQHRAAEDLKAPSDDPEFSERLKELPEFTQTAEAALAEGKTPAAYWRGPRRRWRGLGGSLSDD
jgi:hypothetical protein